MTPYLQNATRASVLGFVLSIALAAPTFAQEHQHGNEPQDKTTQHEMHAMHEKMKTHMRSCMAEHTEGEEAMDAASMRTQMMAQMESCMDKMMAERMEGQNESATPEHDHNKHNDS